jgi:DNA-binding response OmpR family regulator
MGFNVVVVENDTQLAKSLTSQFHSIHFLRSGEELRERVSKNRPEAVILDMEQSCLSDIRSLRHDFPWLPILCTHRLPDEELWVAALEAGASEFCANDEVQGVLTGILRKANRTRRAVA